MTHRQKILLIVAVVVLALFAAITLALTSRQDTAPQPIPEVSASPTPAVSLEEQQRVKEFAEAFTKRYYNYRRPDDPSYLESFKSYVSEELYLQIVAGNRKASRFPNIPSLSSSIESVEVTDVAPNQVEVTATIKSTPAGGSAREENVMMTWRYANERWHITELKVDGNSRG